MRNRCRRRHIRQHCCRIFSLLLGTTLFVMIWTMQDGNHSAPRMGLAVTIRPIPQDSEEHKAVTVFTPVGQPEAVSVATGPAATEQTLWIFADEPAAQIAVK